MLGPSEKNSFVKPKCSLANISDCRYSLFLSIPSHQNSFPCKKDFKKKECAIAQHLFSRVFKNDVNKCEVFKNVQSAQALLLVK
jgi:hypothetical protein